MVQDLGTSVYALGFFFFGGMKHGCPLRGLIKDIQLLLPTLVTASVRGKYPSCTP